MKEETKPHELTAQKMGS